MMTDPIADMLTRIRNAYAIDREKVDVPASRLKEAVAQALKREGYITDVTRYEAPPRDMLRIYLKYGPRGEKVFQEITRVSKPGRRVYAGAEDIPTVRNGLGVALVTTPNGILSDRECRKQRVGGEVLCTIW